MSGTEAGRRYFVYIMASKPWGTLYVGVRRDLQSRVYQHRNGLIAGFTETYWVKTLVYFEEHESAASAIHREKRLKKWPRAWKINLIRTENPDGCGLVSAGAYARADRKMGRPDRARRRERAMTEQRGGAA